MFRIIYLLVVLAMLIGPPLFGKYLGTEQEYELQVGMLKILVMFLCCFVMNEIPWTKTFTKALSIIILITSCVLAVNYIYIIVNDDPNDTILIEQEE